MRAIAATLLMLLCLPADAGERWFAIDGDSVRTPTGETIRVMGVDTPELGGARCPAEYAAAVAARAFTQSALDRGPVRIEPTRRDRYGRTLARVYVGDQDLAGMLIHAGHGREYHGEKRAPWC